MVNPRASLGAQWRDLRGFFVGLTLYEQFEHAVILLLTILLAVVVASATWHLVIIVTLIIFTNELGTDQAVFQSVFGMIFTIIIALEFRHSLVMALAREESIVRVQPIILIAMLATVRKFIVLDIAANANEVFALSAAILSLGLVYFLVRGQDKPRNARPEG